MLVDFNNIKEESKLIIFSSDKAIIQNSFIRDLEAFLKFWKSHGREVVSSFKIFFNFPLSETDNLLLLINS